MAVLASRRIQAPFTEKVVRGLALGESVLLSGPVFTARDRLHKHIFEGGALPVALKDGALFHCGPVMLQKEGVWQVRAAGPTTSMREEPYVPTVIRTTGIRVIIGKGGMGAATEEACAKFGCVYLQATGGAAQVLARTVERVQGVHFEKEFGMAEAMWELVVKDLPAIVAVDARGDSLFRKVAASSCRARYHLLRDHPAEPGGKKGRSAR